MPNPMEKYPEGRRCVFPLCKTHVSLRVVGGYPGTNESSRRYETQHVMAANSLLSDVPCPMSLQYVGFYAWDPTPLDTQRLIAELLPIYRKLAEEAYQHYKRERELHNGPTSTPNPHSQAVKSKGPGGVPTRMGREPEPTALAWALGGREDEDSGHESPAPHQHVPSYVGGYSMTPGMGNMLVGQAKAHFAAAMHQEGEAMAAGQNSSEQLSGSIASVQEALSNMLAVAATDESPTIASAIAQLNQAEASYRAAQDAIEQGQVALIGAQEKAQVMINFWSI